MVWIMQQFDSNHEVFNFTKVGSKNMIQIMRMLDSNHEPECEIEISFMET